MPNHLIRNWSLRISYPDDDILLWDDDATGAFRQYKLHPDIVQQYKFIYLRAYQMSQGNSGKMAIH
eukprot:1357409-Ditylum_brightwellii.AAC.1